MKRFYTSILGILLSTLTMAQSFTFEPAGEKGLTIATVTEKGGTWILREGIEGNYQDYYAVNLPDELKREGTEVVFTGTIGKIPANVRMMGRPVELDMIKKLYKADANTTTNDLNSTNMEKAAKKDSVIRLENVDGMLINFKNQWIIEVKEDGVNTKYLPENLPEDFQTEGLEVAFTGMALVPEEANAIRPMRIIDMVAYEETSFDSLAVQEPLQGLYPFEPIGKVEGKLGILKMMGDDVFIFETDNGTTRYLPALLPKEFRESGIKVIITGYYGEIPPNVRLMGIPFEIESIELAE